MVVPTASLCHFTFERGREESERKKEEGREEEERGRE